MPPSPTGHSWAKPPPAGERGGPGPRGPPEPAWRGRADGPWRGGRRRHSGCPGAVRPARPGIEQACGAGSASPAPHPGSGLCSVKTCPSGRGLRPRAGSLTLGPSPSVRGRPRAGPSPGRGPLGPPGRGAAGGEGVALGAVPAPRCVRSPFTRVIAADVAEREQIAVRLELQIAFLTLQGFPNLDMCAVYTYITVVYGDYQRGQSCLWVVFPKRSSRWLCSGVPGDSGWASSRYSSVLGAGSVCSPRLFTRGPPGWNPALRCRPARGHQPRSPPRPGFLTWTK